MEWENAKTYILLFFILLNGVLALFTITERRHYTVLGEHEATIRTVLAAHDITMTAEMIRRFPPMRALRLSGYYYCEYEMVHLFFPDPARVTRQEDAFGVLFYYGEADLWISDGGVVYFNPDGLGITPQAFIAQHFPDFERDERFTPFDEEGERIIYRQIYRGFTVYSNAIEFLLTEAGIIEVVMQFGYIHGWDGPERPIFAPDEALISFLQRVQIFNHPVTIWHMDIVYFIEFDAASAEPGTEQHAAPFYRIFTYEFDMPFLINAYLNEIVG